MQRNIDLDQLESFLKEFTKNNISRPTRLEVFDEMGAQTQEHGLPLKGIDLEMKGDDAPRVEIMLGGLSPGDPHLTHTIIGVKRVYVKIGDDNRDEVLEFESQKDIKTLLHFDNLEEISAA
ncbi:MAG: DUF5335 family protein [Thermodesulfobacteriota bacterium]